MWKLSSKDQKLAYLSCRSQETSEVPRFAFKFSLTTQENRDVVAFFTLSRVFSGSDLTQRGLEP